jgi:Transmembrane domain of unknown function (DUF3566)
MADSRKDSPIAPRRSLGGPILPPPPPEMAQEAEHARAEQAQKKEQKQSAEEARQERQARREADKARKAHEARERSERKAEASRRPSKPATAPTGTSTDKRAPRRTRRAQLRLVQIDAWSVMKTSFLLSIALGIVLVVAVAIIWSVLGAAGVWDSINSIVQQAVGNDSTEPFDIQEYAGTSRVLGFTMIVAVLDVILITAIATLGAFLYNLSAALLGGIEVTLAEDN